MKLNWEKIKYFKMHWKLGVHLTLRTKRFGVNNKWWAPYNSMFGWSLWKRLTLAWPPNLMRSASHVRARMAPGISMVNYHTYKMVWEEPFVLKKKGIRG